MPQIAQQDYIFIPILDGGTFPEEIPQEIQNRLVRLAQDGRILDVVLTESLGSVSNFFRPIATLATESSVMIYVYVPVDESISVLECEYREITDEPEPDAQ